jgi:hypothetical protein
VKLTAHEVGPCAYDSKHLMLLKFFINIETALNEVIQTYLCHLKYILAENINFRTNLILSFLRSVMALRPKLLKLYNCFK